MAKNQPKTGAIVLYKSKGGSVAVDVKVQEETVWLTQADIANLFAVNIPAISKHINNIVDSGELKKSTTVSKMEIVQKEGKRHIKRKIDYYNLDMPKEKWRKKVQRCCSGCVSVVDCRK